MSQPGTEARGAKQLSRRGLLGLLAAAAVERAAQAAPAAQTGKLHTRKIPSSGEALPVLGMGTWETFDVSEEAAARAPLKDVLGRFFSAGAKVIDSSPMYGRAEGVVGDLVQQLGKRPVSFLATKVWTTGRAEGVRQMDESLRRFRTERVDLMQVHNLVDVKTQLPTLREWKAAGKIRYLGVTHYQPSAFSELEQLIRTQKLDFVQLPYSVAMREAEKRLLPAAAEHGTAVLVMRPFEGGTLFREARAKPLPEFAAEWECTSWAQLFLKFLLGHPAVTCPIPATRNPEHVADNLKAGLGRLPDAAMRSRLIQYFERK